MLKKNVIIIAIVMSGLCQVAYAQEASRLNIDSSKNYIQSGFMASSGSNPDIVGSTVESGSGGFITFYRRISDQILLGLGHDVYSASTHATSDNCVGDLSTANCISTNHAIRVQSLEFSTIFYFKDMGYKNWGFYLSPAVGYSNVKMTGSFDRYDTDPGIFCGLFGGNCRRLQEAGATQTKSYNTGYLKLGGGYQFIWTPNSMIAGHILDLGISYSSYLDKEALQINLPSGASQNILLEKSVQLRISYAIVF